MKLRADLLFCCHIRAVTAIGGDEALSRRERSERVPPVEHCAPVTHQQAAAGAKDAQPGRHSILVAAISFPRINTRPLVAAETTEQLAADMVHSAH